MKRFSFTLIQLTLAIAFVVATNPVFSQQLSYRFRHLTVDNGLSHTDATSIVQDDNGFIWIATYLGLNRFDGYTTKVFYNSVADRTAYVNRITDMELCSKNYLWMATEGGLVVFNPGTLSYPKITAADTATANRLLLPVVNVEVGKSKLYTVSNKEVTIYSIQSDFVLKKEKKSFKLPDTFFGMETDDKGNLWINHNSGLSVVTVDGVFKSIEFEDAASSTITAIHRCKTGDILISNQTGMFVLNLQFQNQLLKSSDSEIRVNTNKLKKIIQYPSSFVYPNNIVIDKFENIWMSTSNGLVKYEIKNNRFFRYVESEFEENAVSSNSINSVFIDKSECLWMTTFGGGVNLTDMQQKPFQLLQRIPNSSNTLSGNYIRALLEDEKGNLWVGTRNSGLNYFNFSTQKFLHFRKENSGLRSNNIRSITKDFQNRLWIGTDAGISIMFNDGSIDHLKPGIGAPSNSFVEGNYFALATDMFGQIWAGAWNTGLSRIVYNGKGNYNVQHIDANDTFGLQSNRITFIYTDQQRPEVLVGTDHGLNHIYLHKDGTINRIINYHSKSGNQLSSEFVWPLVREGDSVIWVGTIGGGLNKIELKSGGAFTIKSISDNRSQSLRDIEGMLMDNDGNLWLAGKLLAMYNPKKNSFVYYDVNDGLQGNSFKIGAAHKGKSGRLYFGGINGLNYFYPSEIVSNQKAPEVSFTELLINGERILPGDNTFEKDISSLSSILFDPSQNNFSIQFSAMHYANPERCKYRYQLRNYDKNWIYTDASNRYATYSNLDYGTYTLVVEAANSDGVWTGVAKEISIRILAPWYKTLIAKIIYILLLLAIVYIVWKYQHSWFDLKRKLQYTVLEEKKQEEIHQMKLQFFTNISHEFRTPLTLILGPTEKMLHQQTSKDEQHNYLRLIYSNARRLLGLTNELMDFRKVETNSMKLNVSRGNLNQFVNSIGAEFRELAAEKNIVYIIKPSSKNHKTLFDADIIEKVLVNLIANAFKYTNEKGCVELEVLDSFQLFKPKYKNHVLLPSAHDENELQWIRIADTGIGISSNSINNIFDRYFRVNTSGREKHLGSGVGLALVKSLIELHKGALYVYSERNEGTEFLIGLPSDSSAYNVLEISDDEKYQIDFESIQYTIDWINDEEYLCSKSSPSFVREPLTNSKRLLIVEDNKEMRRFLVESLGSEYETFEAENGFEGLNKTREYFPDLIISDLMMPDMDGNEFCKAVRSDINICHTPFILITAKSSFDSHLKGVECGADIYFPKPFSLRLLQVTIRNLFEQRDKLKAKYNQDVFAEARELVTTNRDKEFLDELIGIIEKNIENEELDVDMICKKIGMSRTKLYGKVKGVTGQPIGEFIRVLRLKQAAKILVAEDVAIQEVMFRVGIQSQSYFTKAFKKEFGKTPSQFVSSYNKS
jgi:signal transduction histidine kinase/DNA-binding response OmpR family regulator/sugar lactone lactonase YvrE